MHANKTNYKIIPCDKINSFENRLTERKDSEIKELGCTKRLQFWQVTQRWLNILDRSDWAESKLNEGFQMHTKTAGHTSCPHSSSRPQSDHPCHLVLLVLCISLWMPDDRNCGSRESYLARSHHGGRRRIIHVTSLFLVHITTKFLSSLDCKHVKNSSTFHAIRVQNTWRSSLKWLAPEVWNTSWNNRRAASWPEIRMCDETLQILCVLSSEYIKRKSQNFRQITQWHNHWLVLQPDFKTHHEKNTEWICSFDSG